MRHGPSWKSPRTPAPQPNRAEPLKTRSGCAERIDPRVTLAAIIACGILRTGVVGILSLLRTDMLRKGAEPLNKALRGGVLVLEWRRYPS